MGRISALTELTSLASDDYLVVLDSSANIAKKITVANAFGIPELGFTAAGESWTFSSWNSTTKIGVITVPSNATLKYAKGMWIKITQSTGGTKYGYIVALTSTSLTVNFFNLYTLNNEAITSPSYSIAHQPLGTPSLPVIYTDAAGWKVVDFGRFKEWWSYTDKNVSVSGGNRDGGTTVNPPTGVADMNNGTVRVTQTYNGAFAAHATFGMQGNSCFIGSQYSSGSLTFNGRIHHHLTLHTEVY